MSTFKGVIVPMVTPFNRDEEQSINYEAAEQLLEKLISEGADGIFTFGSNGEFHVCNPDEKIKFSKFIIEKTAGRLPVYVGTGACSTKEALYMSREAEAIGADALSVINPYFLGISDQQLVEYFKTVAASVKIPVLLYNIPKGTGKNISKEAVEQLVTIESAKLLPPTKVTRKVKCVGARLVEWILVTTACLVMWVITKTSETTNKRVPQLLPNQCYWMVAQCAFKAPVLWDIKSTTIKETS